MLQNTRKSHIPHGSNYRGTVNPNPQYDPQGQPPYNQFVWSVTALEYAHRDHLGGIEAVTDQLGNKLHQLTYEPYGSRKDSDWRSNIDTLELTDILSNEFSVNSPVFPLGVQYHARVARGFTGHEHLDRTGFIHMNGRVYDPTLGRFLSPDPIVQAPTYSQDWNRYSYGFNNPLTFTDPTGFTENDNTTENNNTIEEITAYGVKPVRIAIIIDPWRIHEQLTNRAIEYFAMYDAYLAELTRLLFSTVRTPSSELSGDGMSKAGQEDSCAQEVTGRWGQKPFPIVTGASAEFGKGNARRPDDWWKIWNNLGTYKAMEHKVAVDTGYRWAVQCEDCSGTWELEGGFDRKLDVWVPISTPAIPHPGGYYAFMARNTYSLLIKPATSTAMQNSSLIANAFELSNKPTDICRTHPRPSD